MYKGTKKLPAWNRPGERVKNPKGLEAHYYAGAGGGGAPLQRSDSLVGIALVGHPAQASLTDGAEGNAAAQGREAQRGKGYGAKVQSGSISISIEVVPASIPHVTVILRTIVGHGNSGENGKHQAGKTSLLLQVGSLRLMVAKIFRLAPLRTLSALHSTISLLLLLSSMRPILTP